jgi:hypothetical protein
MTMLSDDLKTTAGELKAQLKDIPDDAPLLILYDSQAGVSTGIEVVTEDVTTPWDYGPVDWAEPNTVYLDISRGQ